MHRFALAAATMAAAMAGQAMAQTRNDVLAKDVIVEPPTLIALGFEWNVDGDDNGDAAVAVSYRKTGETAWREALPMLRLNRIDRSGQYGPPVPMDRRANLFAGSVFDLEPNTDYETRLVMSDPDGAAGQVERIVAARTRAEPMPARGGRVFHVYPPDHKGPVQQPAFVGLMAAYLNGNNIAADHYNVYAPRVRPGDTILVHAGVYKDDWHYYATSSAAVPPSGEIPANATCCGATFHGTYFLTADGTADKPIVIKGAGDGEAIFDGDGNDTLFNLVGGDNHYFEGLTFRNTKVAIQAGWKGIAGSVGLTVKRSRFENVGDGIHTDWGGARNFYIADNVFIGRDAPDLLVPWQRARNGRLAALGVPPEASAFKSEYAVKVYGSGHVIAFNSARDFHDAFDHATYGVPENWPDTPRDRLPVANDFYNNDMSNLHDDCIEIDGILYNARVLRNRCINTAGAAFSTQGPALAGPIYIVRNIAYHIPGPFAALKSSGAAGLLVYNNSFAVALRSAAPSALSDMRNNLFLAEYPEEPAVSFPLRDGSPRLDHNGYMAGAKAPAPFVQPAPGLAPGEEGPRPPPAPPVLSPSLADFRARTGQDAHSRMVDYSVFATLAPADIVQVTRVYDPATLNFQLRAKGPGIDAGMRLPQVTDGYSGKAPDLGALELGAPPPHYGPRP